MQTESEVGDPVVYVTTNGNEKQGVITGFSLNGGAKITFSTGDEFSEGSWAFAANTQRGDSDGQNCYYHPENPDWGDDING